MVGLALGNILIGNTIILAYDQWLSVAKKLATQCTNSKIRGLYQYIYDRGHNIIIIVIERYRSRW